MQRSQKVMYQIWYTWHYRVQKGSVCLGTEFPNSLFTATPDIQFQHSAYRSAWEKDLISVSPYDSAHITRAMSQMIKQHIESCGYSNNLLLSCHCLAICHKRNLMH